LAARKGESDIGLWEGKRKEEGEKGKAGGGGGVDGCGGSDLGLGIVLFILFFKPVQFGPVQLV